jgi:hypothetical protein
MVQTLHSTLPSEITQATSAAGLQIVSSTAGISLGGAPTTRFTLALNAQAHDSQAHDSQARDSQTRDSEALPRANQAEKTLYLELSDSFEPARPEFRAELTAFLAETAARLRNPVPNGILTLTGIPLTYADFAWPFHESSAGADTSLVHGLVRLDSGADENGQASPLHAKIAAAMTVTFREIVKAPEQPFAESFILNAVRKTFDQGQLELVKSGNRQPVPVTTRYYSARNGKFVFNDTDETQRRRFLEAKAFWFSGVPANGSADPDPVWLLDPRDAQYLNASVADLKLSVEALAKEGMIQLSSAAPAYASPTPSLMARSEEFHAHLAEALAFIKPSFNESMRAGQTNM